MIGRQLAASLFAGFLAVGLPAGCNEKQEDGNASAVGEQTTTQPDPSSRRTYVVRRLDDRIEFYGIDRPWVVEERDGDVIEMHDKIGRHNRSRSRRALAEQNKALSELRPLVKEASTEVLLASLRCAYLGYTDQGVSCVGNLLILAELAKRRPLPKELVADFNAGRIAPNGVFLGVSAPIVWGIDGLMDHAADFDPHLPK